MSPPVVINEMDVPAVRVRDLIKRFERRNGQQVRALDQISLDVSRGEFVVLLGPSGCGKTTLLRSIAGLETPDAGSIDVLDRTVYSSEGGTFIPTERRDISLMFQTYALWPHMTVFDNVAYPLRATRTPKPEIRTRVEALLNNVGIGDLGGQYPSELSGGQQQRVALARTLAREPKVILFDEPLSNVDAKVREQVRVELITMQQTLGFAAVYVTHDQTEAMALADRLVVMRDGQIVQQGSPEEVYRRPTTLYAAEFIGTANRLDGEVMRLSTGGACTVRTRAGEISVDDRTGLGPALRVGQKVHLVIRPEDLHVESRAENAGANSWKMRHVAAMFSGSHVEHALVAEGLGQLLAWSNHREALPAAGSDVWVSVRPERIHVIIADKQTDVEDSGRSRAVAPASID